MNSCLKFNGFIFYSYVKILYFCLMKLSGWIGLKDHVNFLIKRNPE